MVEVKRLISETKGENTSIGVANVLVLLSRGGEEMKQKRMFDCRTCNKRFSSFQALGGHRASHKKPRLPESVIVNNRPKVYRCSICGLQFAIGQALGGHMRRHRTTNEGFAQKKSNRKRELILDLNSSSYDDIEHRELGLELRLGLELVD